MKVRIRLQQKMTYEFETEVTEEQLEFLERKNYDDIYEHEDEYGFAVSLIDRDACTGVGEIEDFEVEVL